MMEWAPSKREAEPDSAPPDRSKAQRTEQGKGRPGPLAPSNKPHSRKAGGKGRHTHGPHHTHMIKALARLALQQETALKIETRLQLGPVCPAWQSGTSPTTLCGRAKMEEDPGGGAHHHSASHNAVRLPDPDATHRAERHRERRIDPIPEEGGRDEVAEGRTLVLPKVSPALGSLVVDETAAAHQAAGSIVECAAADNAALHDTSIPRNQAPHGQHDRNHHLPTRCFQPHRWTSESVGVPGDNDGPDGATSHWTSAPTRLAQAITSCRACAQTLADCS